MGFLRRIAVSGLCAAWLVACARDGDATSATPSSPPPLPSLSTPNVVVGATVGTAITVDATQGGRVFSDPAGSGMSYAVTLSGQTAGLTTSGGVIRGTPSAPGVTIVRIIGTDALGRSVSDQFAIVVFEAGLALPILPATPFRYADADVPLPPHFAAVVSGQSVVGGDNTPSGNAITNAGATLGRVLFFDPRLSANDRTSCGACHLPAISYSDATQFSVGFAGALTSRHAPALVNARFYRRGNFFWDERAATLEDQVLGPIQNAGEMGMTLDALEYKLTATTYYKSLFTAAFGTADITRARIAAALAQYVRAMVSGGSRYDRAFAANGIPDFTTVLTANEQAGEQLFRSAGCTACHVTLAQVSDSVHNTGLDAVATDSGAGNGAFKSPSLRNVGVRTKFMHDGRFSSLDEVVEFYNAGVQANPFLDARLKAPDGSPRRLGLSPAQKSSLVAFLKSLTDTAFLTAPRFANPFVAPVVAPPPAAAVTIQSNSFTPSTLTVGPGTVVAFTNLDNSRHSAQFDAAQIASTPIFTSGTQPVIMPAAAGTYTYHCAIHGQAMRGAVVVR